jgi:hypothetical protein
MAFLKFSDSSLILAKYEAIKCNQYKQIAVFHVMFNKRVGVFYHNIKHDA